MELETASDELANFSFVYLDGSAPFQGLWPFLISNLVFFSRLGNFDGWGGVSRCPPVFPTGHRDSRNPFTGRFLLAGLYLPVSPKFKPDIIVRNVGFPGNGTFMEHKKKQTSLRLCGPIGPHHGYGNLHLYCLFRRGSPCFRSRGLSFRSKAKPELFRFGILWRNWNPGDNTHGFGLNTPWCGKLHPKSFYHWKHDDRESTSRCSFLFLFYFRGLFTKG